MTKKMYAFVGSWHFRPVPRGITVYKYDPENGSLEMVESGFCEVNAAQVTLDPERKIAYFADARGDHDGQIGGGGYVFAFRVAPDTGKLTMISRKESVVAGPEYICLDNTKQYALVAHFAGFGHVTKVVRKENGKFDSETLFDDAALVLFRINEDGTFGDVCDVSITRGEGSASGPHVFSIQHSVVADPSGELFAICDRGQDKIYTYHLDRENGKLIPLRETIVETGYMPRYGTFHPTLPIYYANNERKTIVHGYRYDVSSGELRRVCAAPLLLNEKAAEGVEGLEPADILIHPNGKHLYVTVRGVNLITVLDVDDEGELTLKQNISCGGKSPRGLCISPDKRFLFSLNTESNSIAQFAVGVDGSLTATGQEVEGRRPSCMAIMTV